VKVFLTGASGLCGSNVAAVAARRGHEVLAVVGASTAPIAGAARVLALDLAREPAVQAAVLDWFPDAIVNCAAVSSPAQCETQPDLSRQLNVALPTTLAQLAHHLGARLIHLSSEQVFDGTRDTPYRRDDPVNPPNLYGRQKVESEHRVAEFAPDNAVTVRLPLLGGNSLTGRRSLHERCFADWAAGRRTRLYRDEVRQPCSAENAAEAILELAERTDLRGVMHWAGEEALTRVEMGRRVAAHFGVSVADWIEEAARADDPGGAARQAALRLDCAPLAGRLKTRLESFAELLDKLVVPPPCRAWYAGLGPPPSTPSPAP
jgi:dTDP-4-dehydrorhamnose reductase